LIFYEAIGNLSRWSSRRDLVIDRHSHSDFGHLVKEGPEEKRTNLGVWSEVSGPLRYRPVLLMTIADGLSRQNEAGRETRP